MNIDFNANDNSLKDAPKHLPARFIEDMCSVIYTEFVGQPDEKERRLKNMFRCKGWKYSREVVKDAFFNQYKARGGWREKEEFTGWIFND